MALPFIVGPHQCSLTQGPDGRPQVEVVLRIRLPLAEFFDALLLTLAEQHPLFPQGGHVLDPATIAPVKAGLQAKERPCKGGGFAQAENSWSYATQEACSSSHAGYTC